MTKAISNSDKTPTAAPFDYDVKATIVRETSQDSKAWNDKLTPHNRNQRIGSILLGSGLLGGATAGALMFAPVTFIATPVLLASLVGAGVAALAGLIMVVVSKVIKHRLESQKPNIDVVNALLKNPPKGIYENGDIKVRVSLDGTEEEKLKHLKDWCNQYNLTEEQKSSVVSSLTAFGRPEAINLKPNSYIIHTSDTRFKFEESEIVAEVKHLFIDNTGRFKVVSCEYTGFEGIDKCTSETSMSTLAQVRKSTLQEISIKVPNVETYKNITVKEFEDSLEGLASPAEPAIKMAVAEVEKAEKLRKETKLAEKEAISKQA